jgi:hypothetical protein
VVTSLCLIASIQAACITKAIQDGCYFAYGNANTNLKNSLCGGSNCSTAAHLTAIKNDWATNGSTVPTTNGWGHCAAEAGTCTCIGTARYGKDSTWLTKPVTGSILCDPDAINGFGSDPVPLVVKTCECQSTTFYTSLPDACVTFDW